MFNSVFKCLRNFDYDVYWENRGAKIRTNLREREYIFFDWIKENSSVLDIACGNSPLLIELKKKKNCLVEGFDISSKVVEEQRKAGITAAVQNIANRDFKLEKNYDYIIASEILEHLVYPEILLEKIRKNTKYLIISVPNSAFYRFRWRLFFKGRFFIQWFQHPAEHLRYWSHNDFLDWLEALNFEVIEIKASNGLDIGPLKFFKFWPNLFGHQICYLVKGDRDS